MVREVETIIGSGGNNQLQIYFSKKLDMPFKKGTKVLIQVIKNKVVISKIE